MSTIIPQDAPVLITESAAARLQALISDAAQPGATLRIAVRPGGCTGFKHDLFLDTDVDEADYVSTQDGVTVVVDPHSAGRLIGAVLDYQDRGLEGGGFTLENPNQTRTCGCGQSFA